MEVSRGQDEEEERGGEIGVWDARTAMRCIAHGLHAVSSSSAKVHRTLFYPTPYTVDL